MINTQYLVEQALDPLTRELYYTQHEYYPDDLARIYDKWASEHSLTQFNDTVLEELIKLAITYSVMEKFSLLMLLDCCVNTNGQLGYYSRMEKTLI